MSAARGALRAVSASLGAVLLLWVASLVLVVAAGAWPTIGQADAILVLGAAQYNGRPSPVYQARLDHALLLYDQGFAPHLIVTGGVGRGDTLSEGEVGRRYALDHGVPADAILVEREGVTSAESVKAAAALMRGYEMRTALVVSDPFHMMRLEVLTRRAGIRPRRAPTPTSRITRESHLWGRYVLRESVLFPAAALLGAY
jgi:uncharacterized SAM-binding protein YcdF (DUF218 family)